MASRQFGRETTGTTVAQTFQEYIQGKNVIITGASPGSIGEAAAVAIARAQPGLLILASRTSVKLEAVARLVRRQMQASRDQKLREGDGQTQPQQQSAGLPAQQASPAPGAAPGGATVSTRTGAVRIVVVDLSSQVSVRKAASEIAALTDRIDVLINNAGINVKDRQLSPEGIELTFATNHIGPFLLTRLLLPLLRKAAAESPSASVRVVNVSSSGHRISPMRFSDYNFTPSVVPAADELPRVKLPDWLLETTDGFPSNLAYGSSKTANILFTVGLNQRLLDSGIQSFAVHPGDILTNLVRDIPPQFKQQLASTPPDALKSPDQGCATLLVAAFDPALKNSHVVYLEDCRAGRPAKYAVDATNAHRLWRLSEELTMLPFSRQGKL